MPGLILVITLVLTLVYIMPSNAHEDRQTRSRYDEIAWMDVNAKREARERRSEPQVIVYYEIEDKSSDKKHFTLSK